jgi:tetratricopeptide (TPR) repeat protein/transcriptional regulator with XRE-family HTH domain
MAAQQPLVFGELLKRYRLAAGLSQQRLAERAGLSERAVSDLERGLRRAPQRATLRLLAAALRLGPEDHAALEAIVVRSRPPAARSRPLRGSATRAHTEPVPPAGLLPLTAAALPPLVGREPELARLEGHLAGVGPPLLLLAGEPGIGKSRLLAEAAHHAPGWTVLAGGCQRRGDQEPFAPLLGALQGYLHGRAPAHLRAALHDCAWLVRLLPELLQVVKAPFPAWTLPSEQERRLMFAAVARFLANVAGPAGTLLVLDDLQWAGADALELLASLLHAPAQPLRLLGAYRSTEVDPQSPLAVALADLAHAGLATQLTLGPLVGADAERLLDTLLREVGPMDARLRAPLVQRAGGVPFFAVSCVRALRPGAREAAALPWDLRHSIRQRAALLTVEARAVLGAAAVIGRRVSPGLLAAVAARPEEAVLAALEAAGRAQLLLEEEDAAAYQFAHDVIREVIEADVGVARRAVLHRRVAEALEALPGAPPVELLAYHYSRSEAHEKAVQYLEQAGDRAAAQHAHAAAEDYDRELADRLERLGRTLEAAAAREKLGRVLRTVARYDEALAVLEQAGAAYRAAGDREGACRTLAQIGLVHAVRGTAEDGVRRLQAALETVGTQEPSHGLAALYAALAHLYFADGRIDEQLAAAEQAVELARAVGDDRILADAETKRGLALLLLGRMEDAQCVLEEAIPLAEAAGDLDILGRALTNVGGVYGARGELEQGRRYAERALKVAEQRDDAAQVVFATVTLGTWCFFVGDWARARGHLERALALGRAIGAPRVVGPPLVLLGRLCLAEGSWDESSRYLEEGCTIADRGAGFGLLLDAQALLAEREILEGHPDAACARLAPLLDAARREVWGSPYAQATLAWAHLEMGDVAAADELVGQAVRRARVEGYGVALVGAQRVQALVAARQERWEEAERALEEGLALAWSMPYPYAEGRLLHVYGEMHAQKGEPEPARARLEAALAIFRRQGARKDTEQVARALATHVEGQVSCPRGLADASPLRRRAGPG